AANDAIVRIVGWILGHLGAERAPHFHAGEDGVDSVLIPPFHPLQIRPDAILFALTFLRLQDGDFVVAGVAFYPSPVFQGTLCQNLWGDRILPMHVAEKIDD